MGGAARNERKRRQQQAARGRGVVARARGTSGGNRTPIIAAVAALALVVVIGIVYQVTRDSGSGDPKVERTASSYPVNIDAANPGVILAGKPGAPVVLDVYEDFLCPYCGLVERRDGARMAEAMNQGRLAVRYHPVNLLDGQSRPEGYSTQAGNAAICAVSAGVFPDFHASLFAKQPEEGGAGFSTDQLIDLMVALGASGDYQQCVLSKRNDAVVKANYVKADQDPKVRKTAPNGETYFGTPTILVNGTMVEDPINNAAWLDEALASVPAQ